MNDVKNFMEAINKKYKTELICPGNRFPEVPRIPFDIFTLDYAVGGGIPIGRMSLIFGKKASAKTYLAYRIIKSAQSICYNCYKSKHQCKCKKFGLMYPVYMDIEKTWSELWARKVGIDTAKMDVARPDSAEQTIDVVYEFLKDGRIGLIVIDSVAAMIPITEEEQSVAKWQQGLLARLLGKASRKWIKIMNAQARDGKRQSTLLIINQIREKIGITFGDTTTTPGGHAVKFAASTVIRTWGGTKYEIDKESEKPKSVKFGFKVVNNKVSNAGMDGEFELCLRDDGIHKKGNVLDDKIIFNMAQDYDLIKKMNSKWVFAGKEFATLSAIKELWVKKPEVYEKVKQELLDLLMSL